MGSRALFSVLRRLRRSPRLTGAAIVCIAIGTAATAAGLTLVSATLLAPLPFRDAERLVRVWLTRPSEQDRLGLSYPFLEPLEKVRSFDAVEAAGRARLLFQTDSGGQRVEGEAVTAGYFSLLGVEPEHGRLLLPEDYASGAVPAMVLDYRAWGSMFGFDPQVVGRQVRTDQGVFEVVGVLPASFTGTVEEDSGDIRFWVPLEVYLPARARQSWGWRNAWVLAHLSDGATVEGARSEVEILAQELEGIQPADDRGLTLDLEPFGASWRSRIRSGALLLLACALLLLVVATANVAILLVARSLEMRRELAVRTALGAGRGRLVLASLCETAILVAVGGGLGLLLGPPLLRALLHQQSLVDGSMFGIPVFVHLAIDPRSGALSLGVFALTALAAGLGPALLGARVDPARALAWCRGAASTSRRARSVFGTLVVLEVLVTMVLLTGATVLARSYRDLWRAPLGYRTHDVLRVAIFPSELDAGDSSSIGALYERVRAGVLREPGVEKAGLVWPTVPIDWLPMMRLSIASGDPSALRGGASNGGALVLQETGLPVTFLAVDPELLDTLEIPVLRGRGIRDSDRLDAPPVALVSMALARRLAAAVVGGGSADGVLGQEVQLGGDGASRETVRVVGIVADARFAGPRQEGEALQVYAPLAQNPRGYASLMVASRGDPRALIEPVRRRILEQVPAAALDWIGPLDRWNQELYYLDNRFFLSLVGLFSLAGLVLSATGLLAVLSSAVAARRAEIGVRQALGATPRHVVLAVAGDGLWIVARGLIAGGLLYAGLARLLRSMVYGVGVVDAPSLALAGLVVLAVGALACLLPARRAARVAPAEVLREG